MVAKLQRGRYSTKQRTGGHGDITGQEKRLRLPPVIKEILQQGDIRRVFDVPPGEPQGFALEPGKIPARFGVYPRDFRSAHRRVGPGSLPVARQGKAVPRDGAHLVPNTKIPTFGPLVGGNLATEVVLGPYLVFAHPYQARVKP